MREGLEPFFRPHSDEGVLRSSAERARMEPRGAEERRDRAVCREVRAKCERGSIAHILRRKKTTRGAAIGASRETRDKFRLPDDRSSSAHVERAALRRGTERR